MARDADIALPFRWNIASRPELGGLLEAVPETSHDWLLGQLRQALARVLAFSGDGDLIFIGRSPEQLYDAGRALLADTSWRDRLRLLQLSLSSINAQQLLSYENARRQHIRQYMASVGLAPAQILARRRPTERTNQPFPGGV